ncbi:helix-turn-helix transcriptional regulator [Qipengyuania sp. MTN3-11]|uniref:helix-turn-helix transcriptional regulator n=1 Tax=Qipengyuania sp. MTN3-11 TaxID=3056557 RepID=UPI0036F20E35
MIDYEEMFDVDWLRSTEFYNEWWLPQGAGGGSLAANIVSDSGATASITIHAPTSKLGFQRSEKELFGEIVQHLIRSVAILRRLQMAQLVISRAEAEMASGFLVVDREGAVLHSDPRTLTWLESLNLIQNGRNTAQIAPGQVKSLLRRAVDQGEGSSINLVDRKGSLSRLAVIPCSSGENLTPVIIDRPAALIWLISDEQLKEERMNRLSNAFSLTPAETKIAMEACAGGGRAEIAQRCGLSPNTIKSHMEAIYSKTGVHRHAELVHLVERA